MKRIILLLISTLLSLSSFAQIQGYVFDKQNKEPLPGCTVKIREINQATFTDANGFFSFTKLPKGTFTIEFSYLGYQDTIIIVKYQAQPIKLKIYLRTAPIQAEEVIVTGWLPSTQHTSALKVDNIKLRVSNQILPSVLSSLTTVPGVDIISKGIGIGTPVIRGLSRTNIVVLNNGFRLENYQFSENHPFFINSFGVNKIEIIKGPSSLLYGSDAIGGVINVLWGQPAPVNHFNSDYAFQFNSNTKGFMTTAGIKNSSGKFSWGVRTGINANGDMYDGLGEQIKNTRFLLQNIKSFAIINTQSSSHKFYFQYDRDKLGLCVAPAMSLVNDDKLLPEAFYQNLTHFFVGNKNTFFLNSSMNLHANFSYEFNDRAITDKQSEPNPIDMKLNTVNYEIYLTYNSKNITTVFGSQGWLVQNRNFGSTVFLPNYQTTNASSFGLIKLAVSTKVHILTGLRYDFTHIQFTPITDSTISIIQRPYHNISGSFGGTVQLTKYLLLRFNTATAYRNPNVAELGELGIHAFRYEIGNFDLKPQRSFENDISLHIHTSKFIADINVFHNNIKNYIFLAPTADIAQNGMKIYTYNQSNALLYGLETGVKISLNRHLDAKVIYSYIKTRDSVGNPLPLIPQNKIKGFFSYKTNQLGIAKNLRLSLEPVYAFAYKHPAPNEDPSAAYFLLNASLSTNFKFANTQNITLFINIYNLTNTVYSDHLSTLREVGFYDMGRNISAGLRWYFDRKHN